MRASYGLAFGVGPLGAETAGAVLPLCGLATGTGLPSI